MKTVTGSHRLCIRDQVNVNGMIFLWVRDNGQFAEESKMQCWAQAHWESWWWWGKAQSLDKQDCKDSGANVRPAGKIQAGKVCQTISLPPATTIKMPLSKTYDPQLPSEHQHSMAVVLESSEVHGGESTPKELISQLQQVLEAGLALRQNEES